MDWFLYDNGLCLERVKGRGTFGKTSGDLKSSKGSTFGLKKLLTVAASGGVL